MDITRHFTLGFKGMCSLKFIFSHWWKKLEDIPLNFIQEVEDLRDLRSLKDGKPTWNPTSHTMDNVS